MTTQKQWHGSPGGTLTITSFLSQSLRWLMKRKSKGQLCIQARRPHHHLLWREQDGSRRWNAEGDLSKALGMAFHWYLARKRVNMSLLILVWRSNCRNIRKECGNLLCSIVQQTSVTDFNSCSGAGQHPRQWGEGEDHLQQVGHSQREVSLIMTRPQLHGQSRIPSKLLWIYNQLKHGPCSELHGSLWTISQTCLNLWLWPGTWHLPWAASSSILARRCLPIAPRFSYLMMSFSQRDVCQLVPNPRFHVSTSPPWTP